MSCGVLEVLEVQGGTLSKAESLLSTEAGKSRPYTTLNVRKHWRHTPEGSKIPSFDIKTLKSRLC